MLKKRRKKKTRSIKLSKIYMKFALKKNRVEDTFFFFRLTCSVALRGGREGCCKQITLACAHSASVTLGLPPLTARVASLPTLLRL